MGPSLTVPPFDVIIGSNGYVFADFLEDSNPSVFAQTPTYVDRSNTQGDYGDSQQDFWLTWTQRDWSEGEQQKYQGRDDAGKSRYWRGKNIDVRQVGEATIRPQTTSITTAAAVASSSPDSSNNRVYFSTSTNLYYVVADGTITSLGAHGLGATPSRFGMTTYGAGTFISTSSGGVTKVRLWDGAVFSDFSATRSADSLAYLNNTLYGFSTTSGKFFRYDTAGAATDLFTWQGPTGGAATGVTSKLVPFGGKLLILRYRYPPRGAELWVYDGTSTSKLTDFPSNFNAYDCEIVNGTVFVAGITEQQTSTLFQKPTLYFYKDGQQDVLWRHDIYGQSGSVTFVPVTYFDNGLIFGDPIGDGTVAVPRLFYYDASTGGVSTAIELSGLIGNSASLTTAATFSLIVPNIGSGTTQYVWSDQNTTASTGEIDTSQIDFDSSLPKMFRGVRVHFKGGGGTSSVDLSYSVDEGAFTSLQTGATSGTEYKIGSPPTGTTLKIRVTLNKGSGSSPRLKRVQVRAVPVMPSFRRRRYVVNLGGRDGDSPVILRDGTPHAKDGKDMFTDLQAVIDGGSVQSITDEMGTFTGVLEADRCEFSRTKSEQWVATLTVREV